MIIKLKTLVFVKTLSVRRRSCNGSQKTVVHFEVVILSKIHSASRNDANGFIAPDVSRK